MASGSRAEPRTTSSAEGRRPVLDAIGCLLLRLGLLSWRHRRSQPIRPDDAPRARVAGHDPDRLLLLGSGAAVGWGVATHQLSLCGALARSVSRITGRGCEVELVPHPDLLANEAGAVLSDLSLDRFDAIVLAVGVNDAIKGTSPSSWRSSVSRLVDVVRVWSPPTTEFFMLGIQPIRSIPSFDTTLGGIAGRHAQTLNEIARLMCATSQRMAYLPLPAQVESLGVPERHRTAAQYDAWAAYLAPSIAERLETHYVVDGDRRRTHRFSEVARQLTVDGLPLAELANDNVLVKLVHLAQQAFKVETAILTIVDDEHQINLIRMGTDIAEVARGDSFCDLALRQREPLIVRDASKDERFKRNPLVVGDPHIRFYAGFPVSAPDGERVGALCIVDSSPRQRSDDIDLTYLQELAGLAEKELWQILRPKHEEPG